MDTEAAYTLIENAISAGRPAHGYLIVGDVRGAALELLGTHTVRWSDIDYNQHANNVKYTVWAMDALPEELVNEKMVKELTINFNREARPGETVELWHALSPDGAHIIEGRTGDHQVFIERLLFE